MAKAHSIRKRTSRRARNDSPEPRSSAGRSTSSDLPDFAEVRGRLSDGLALVETAHSALRNACEDEALISSGVLTLKRGIDELQSAYTDLDIAMSQWRA